MADLCACQKEGIEAVAKEVCLSCFQGQPLVGTDHHDDTVSGKTYRVLCNAAMIRRLIATPTAPCPRCEVVAAAEAHEKLLADWHKFCLCSGEGSCDICVELDAAHGALLRAIERMRS